MHLTQSYLFFLRHLPTYTLFSPNKNKIKRVISAHVVYFVHPHTFKAYFYRIKHKKLHNASFDFLYHSIFKICTHIFAYIRFKLESPLCSWFVRVVDEKICFLFVPFCSSHVSLIIYTATA